jgi:transcriptional regulator EpsA
MENQLKIKHWEKIFSVIQRSYAIENHLEFFNWLQEGVNELLPHDVLIACWGDFESKSERNKLSYDVASNLIDINTSVILGSYSAYDAYMLFLHQQWVDRNRCWFVLNNLEQDTYQGPFRATLLGNSNQLNSLIVYGVSDVRGGNVCLYVFFSKNKVFDVPDSVMGLIMPHIDNVLRKIQQLKPLAIPSESAFVLGGAALSVRELEIIQWVKLGKTNQEIAIILDISQNTVKSHLKRIFQKMNVTRRAQAVAILMNQLN